MTICRKCGTSNQDGKKFCVFCHELLIADPEEMAKREATIQKKQKKVQKKLDAKHKRWKRALLLLIPIGLLDFVNLLLCLDLAFIGVGNAIGSWLGDLARGLLGLTITLFGNMVYTDQTVEYIVRALEFLGALGLLLIASALAIVMIVRMIKWCVYCRKGAKQQKALAQETQASQASQDETASDAPVQEQTVAEVKVAMGEADVSYASLTQAAAQKQAYGMPAPASETDCKQLFEALTAHLWEYDEDSVRRILSAMSASRLLLCSAGALDSASIFDNLSRAFGVQAEQFVRPEAEEGTAGSIAHVLLQRDEQTGKLTHTAFAKALYTAKFAPKNICLAGVGGVGAGEVHAVFSPLASYFGVPEGNTALYFGDSGAQSVEGIEDGKLVLPANLWIISVLPEHDHVPAVGGGTARYAAAVYLRNSGRAFPPESAEDAKAIYVSVEALQRAVAAAENAYYLSDEYWSVLDALEKQTVEQGGNGFANRTLRMLEKYTSVFLACGGKQSDAFDNGFAAVIVPAYAEQLRALADKSEGESLSAMLERTVGREKLPVTVDVLTAMHLMYALPKGESNYDDFKFFVGDAVVQNGNRLVRADRACADYVAGDCGAACRLLPRAGHSPRKSRGRQGHGEKERQSNAANPRAVRRRESVFHAGKDRRYHAKIYCPRV